MSVTQLCDLLTLRYLVKNRRFGDRNDKLAAPLADKRHLLHDFTFQIPRKDQEVIGSGFADFVRVVDSQCACQV